MYDNLLHENFQHHHYFINFRHGTVSLEILETIKIKIKNKNYKAVLPQIMNFGQIQIPNNIHIFKNDEYEYEYYSEFEKLFEYYSWEIFE